MEFQSKWKRTPKFLALLAIFTTTLFVSLMLTGAKPVNAATKADEITVNSATPKEQAVAKELEKMFVDGDIENLNIDYLIAKYGKMKFRLQKGLSVSLRMNLVFFQRSIELFNAI